MKSTEDLAPQCFFYFFIGVNVCLKGAENGEIDKKQRLSGVIEGKGEFVTNG